MLRLFLFGRILPMLKKILKFALKFLLAAIALGLLLTLLPRVITAFTPSIESIPLMMRPQNR